MLPIKSVAVAVALLLVVGGILFIPLSAGDEIESGFGSWKIEVYAVTGDGEEKQLSVADTMAAQLLSFSYNGEPVSYFRYKLKAKATGAGYSSVELDLSDVRSDGMIGKDEGGNEDWSHWFDDDYGASSVNIPLDDQFHTVYERTYNLPDDGGNGEYTLQIRFISYSYARFRGISSDGNGPWEDEDVFLDTLIPLSVTDSDDGGGGGTDPDPGEETPTTAMVSSDLYYSDGEEIELKCAACLEVNNIPCKIEVNWPGGDSAYRTTTSNVYESFFYVFPSSYQNVEVIARSQNMNTGMWGDWSSLWFFKSGFMMVPLFTIEVDSEPSSSYYVDSSHYLGRM